MATFLPADHLCESETGKSELNRCGISVPLLMKDAPRPLRAYLMRTWNAVPLGVFSDKAWLLQDLVLVGRAEECVSQLWTGAQQSTTSPRPVQSRSASAARETGFTVGWAASASMRPRPKVLAPALASEFFWKQPQRTAKVEKLIGVRQQRLSLRSVTRSRRSCNDVGFPR
jgi:hypothetical protein